MKVRSFVATFEMGPGDDLEAEITYRLNTVDNMINLFLEETNGKTRKLINLAMTTTVGPESFEVLHVTTIIYTEE